MIALVDDEPINLPSPQQREDLALLGRAVAYLRYGLHPWQEQVYTLKRIRDLADDLALSLEAEMFVPPPEQPVPTGPPASGVPNQGEP